MTASLMLGAIMRSVRSKIVSRLLAVLVAFAMGGGLPMIEAHAHDEAPHRCHCHHGPGETCLCAQCGQRPVAAPTEAELAALPPCHRAAALARAKAPAPRSGQPMYTGCCTTRGPAPATLATPEHFILPPALPVGAPGRSERPLASVGGAHDHRGQPPVPPPRAAAPLAA
jgi:hypothetical protein